MIDRQKRSIAIRSLIYLLASLFLIFMMPADSNAVAEPCSLYSTASVEMFQLNIGGSSTGVKCSSGNTTYGCTAFVGNPSYGYPYSNSRPSISIETDYLLDVVAQEMSSEVYDEEIALQAQAIVSRSYVNYFINNPPEFGNPPDVPFNNSTKYQVFIPYRFEKLEPASFPSTPSNPCSSGNLNENQLQICAATENIYYIDLAGDGLDLPAKALFTQDVHDQTRDGTSDKPYLVSVKEPISLEQEICKAENSGDLYGMSQQGANRWALGNMCPYIGDESISWSVEWTYVEQILFHYYTNVHLRDENGILSPDYRWNPLKIENLPSVMLHDFSYDVSMQVQNTGVMDWDCPPYNSYTLVYWWTKGSLNQAGLNSASLCGLTMGDPSNIYDLVINDMPSWGMGGYTLRFDVRHNSYGNITFFSQQNWPTYDRTIFAATSAVYLPSVIDNLIVR